MTSLPENIREVSEMYAVGSISLTQVAEEVAKLPFYQQPLIMSQAMLHAEIYSKEYERFIAGANANNGSDLV